MAADGFVGASGSHVAIYYAKFGGAAVGPLPRQPRRRRRRLWRLDGSGFRELRLSCLMSRKACARYLGVSLRTVSYWDAGRYRVPWSAVRLLRLYRNGDLGGIDAAWEGFRLWRGVLYSPEGHAFDPQAFRAWWWDRQRLAHRDAASLPRSLGSAGVDTRAATLPGTMP